MCLRLCWAWAEGGRWFHPVCWWGRSRLCPTGGDSGSSLSPPMWRLSPPLLSSYNKHTHNQVSTYNNINIIELTMYVAGCVAVCQPTPRTADVTVTKIAGYVRVHIVMKRWFFSYFWDSYFWTYGPFVEYMNMHAASKAGQEYFVLKYICT